MRVQKKLHHCECIEPCRDVVEHNSEAFRKMFQLAHRRRLDDIEDTKKYKTGEKSFPREGDGNQGDELPRDFVDDDKLRIFRTAGAANLRCGGDTDYDDQNHQRDDGRGAQGETEFMGQSSPY